MLRRTDAMHFQYMSQAQTRDMNILLAIQKNISRFQCAMDHMMLVYVVKRISNLFEQRQSLHRSAACLLLKHASQRDFLKEIRHKIGIAKLFTKAISRHNMGMI